MSAWSGGMYGHRRSSRVVRPPTDANALQTNTRVLIVAESRPNNSNCSRRMEKPVNSIDFKIAS